jgi:chorismate mutase
MSSPPSDLANRRAEIDKYDREIHRLLTERAKVVYGVMRAKAAATAAGEVTPPFRPGREAEVLRALVQRHDSEFPVASLLQIWREVMSGATRMQAVQQIAVPAGDPALATLARDHFGVGAEYLAAPDAAGAMAMLQDLNIAAAVVPMAQADDMAQWWCGVLASESPEGAPKVVARLPFFQAGAGGEAVVLSPFPADASSDDRGVLGLTLAEGAGLEPVTTCLRNSGLPPVTAPIQAGPHVWLEVGGLVAADAPVCAQLKTVPGVERAIVLGGYAVPLA